MKGCNFHQLNTGMYVIMLVCVRVPRTLVGSNTAQDNTYVRLPLYCVILDNKTSKVPTTQNVGTLACPLLPWKSSTYYIFWVCVSSLSFPACKAHAPYYIVVRHLSASNIFSHIILYRARLSENFTEHNMCAFIFFTTYVWNISYSEKNSAIFYHNCKKKVLT